VDRLEQNLRLYPLYQIARSGLFWMPVFFLYFQQVLPVDQVLLLEAIYYAGVVTFEVPSGYFSDRIGRRITLLVSAAAWTVGALLFATSSSFVAFAIAQLSIAVGMAFNSGTDTALLYDTLAATGREHELGAREGRAQSYGYLAMAGASLVGGIVGGWDLRLVYALSAMAALASLVIVARLSEPPRHEVALAPLPQVRAVVRSLRQPALAWLFAFWVALVVFEHVPYELVQPYLALLIGDSAEYSVAPAASGALMAGTLGLSAFAAHRAIWLRNRIGAPAALIGGQLLLIGIMVAMAITLHPLLVLAFLLRGAPQAIAQPIIAALVHPKIGSGIRATYFSLQSLAGRLAFAGSLAIASRFVAGDAMTQEGIRIVLVGYGSAAIVVLLALSATIRAVPR
jgi:hypothetical protein